PGVVEIQEVRLGSKVGGRVLEVKIAEGEMATEGQELLVFDVPELKAQIEQQQARVAAAEADAAKMQNGARPQEVHSAWAMMLMAFDRWQKAENGFRPEEIRQARDDLKAAEADLKLAQEEFRREEQLASTTAGKQADYDVARANLNRAQARRQAAQA